MTRSYSITLTAEEYDALLYRLTEARAKFDLSQEALAVAHKTRNDAYEQRIKELLKHIENAADVLNEVRRQLPEGSIVGSVCWAKEQKLRDALAKEAG